MSQLLTRGEQLVVRQSLNQYSKDRNVQRLINALDPVLDDAAKLQMLHYLSELLPEAEQQAFDRAAARMISRKMDSMSRVF